MMKYFLIFLLAPVLCLSQSKRDYNWILGYDMDLNIDGVEGGIIDFTGGQRIIRPRDIGSQRLKLNNASISDQSGKLLFFTNGCDVYDSTYNLMMNGDSLNYNEWYETFCSDGANGFQNTIILPDPASDNGYYILHQPLSFLENPFDIQTLDLRYSYIDMSQDLHGAVMEKNQVYFSDTIGSGFFSACLHENGEDWWFIKSEYLSNRKYVFNLSSDGIQLVHSIEIGDVVTGQVSGAGQAKFSSDGSVFVTNNYFTGVNIYDFDRATGMLSNHENIILKESQIQSNGLEMSPSGRFIYANFREELYQIDLWASDIEESVVLIDTFDGFADPFPVVFGPQQLGPDCKIYMAAGSTVPYLHVINNPDEKGTLCNFTQRGIELPWSNDILSIPNFPHFRIDEEDICDPTITNVFGLPIETQGLALSPNPTHSTIQLEGNYDQADFVILTQDGQQIKSGIVERSNSIDLTNIRSGIYIVKVMSEENIFVGKIVKM